jgi:hypothetical protein
MTPNKNKQTSSKSSQKKIILLLSVIKSIKTIFSSRVLMAFIVNDVSSGVGGK